MDRWMNTNDYITSAEGRGKNTSALSKTLQYDYEPLYITANDNTDI